MSLSTYNRINNLIEELWQEWDDFRWVNKVKSTYLYLTTVIDDDAGEVSTYCLSNNFSNPFNPKTEIKYPVPQTSQVQMKVFDILGNEIETLVDEYNQAGKNEVEFNASSLPNGVYFYQLTAGYFIETKKMVIIR